MKYATSDHRFSFAIAATALAGSLLSSVVLAADPGQAQTVSLASTSLNTSLSMRVFVPTKLVVQQHPGSLSTTRWLQLRNAARSFGGNLDPAACHSRADHGGSSLCHLQWNQHNALSGSSKRFQDYSYETNSNLVRHLANHVEIDLGRTSSISLRYDFY